MTRAASPKLGAYAGLVALGLLAALVLGLPELVLLAAPFALVLALGTPQVRAPHVDVEVELDREQALEGELLDVWIRFGPGDGAEQIDVLLELPPGIEGEEGANPSTLRLVAGEERLLPLRLRCVRWGAFALGRIHLRSYDQFGLFRHEAVTDRRQPLKVYPTQEAVRMLLRPSETQVFSGNHVARQKAEGIEFADIRQFVAGDRVRHVNWRASARRGELWVNEHHAERNADVVIFLDVFAEARRGGRSTLDPALRAAASLAARYLRQRDLVVIPRRTLPPQALVVALTPLLDDRAATALLDLRARGFDLVVIEVSPLELVAPMRGEKREIASRLWRLRRDAVRGRFMRAGVPVAVWDEDSSFAVAMEEVDAFRRHARTAPV